ncbi:MAG: SRPBCC family protein [Patescibacteria group bacterium]|nr:SRPBCC family protein [Patescibacteria group bacterium]
MNKAQRHYEESALVPAIPEELFAYIDDHKQFSSHMSKSSWMMGGGKMEVSVDVDHGQKVGSHIRMGGTAFGIRLSLDEVVTRYEPPLRKTWETVEIPRLLVIGPYNMGIEIRPRNNGSSLRVFIDYNLPTKNAWLGKLFGGMYAKWCVQQMITGAKGHFANRKG